MANDKDKNERARTRDASVGAAAQARPRRRATSRCADARATRDVAEFVRRMKELAPRTAAGRGRLVFAMDATMSRQPTWDMALALQADMFQAVKAVGGLDVQLVYFRGAGECRASRWVSDPDALAALMTRVTCAGGYTQIRKVLSHAREEAGQEAGQRAGLRRRLHGGGCRRSVRARRRAGACSACRCSCSRKAPMPRAEKTFREIARLTKGAYCRFDAGSAAQLRELLSAVAVYAAGGRKALAALSGRGARACCCEQLK